MDRLPLGGGPGVLDGEEIDTYFTDPLDEDTDGDGLNDFEEITLGIVLSPNPLADTAIETAPELVASIS